MSFQKNFKSFQHLNIKDFRPRFIHLTLIYKKSIKLHFLQTNSPSILRQKHSKRT